MISKLIVPFLSKSWHWPLFPIHDFHKNCSSVTLLPLSCCQTGLKLSSGLKNRCRQLDRYLHKEHKSYQDCFFRKKKIAGNRCSRSCFIFLFSQFTFFILQMWIVNGWWLLFSCKILVLSYSCTGKSMWLWFLKQISRVIQIQLLDYTKHWGLINSQLLKKKGTKYFLEPMS